MTTMQSTCRQTQRRQGQQEEEEKQSQSADDAGAQEQEQGEAQSERQEVAVYDDASLEQLLLYVLKKEYGYDSFRAGQLVRVHRDGHAKTATP